ncbi:MAG TPA: Abi-alpha family protein [Gemmatimonadaceae bacterium]|nr:Abi-alpha family protein [Gemmatimonadaceae bacterium]
MSPITPEGVGLAIAAYRLTPTAAKIFLRIVGPLADGIGHSIVPGFLIDRRRKLAERAIAGLQAARAEPVEVPPKILLPLLEHGGLEEDEMLAEKWAALLANAANGQTPGKVRPIYIQILSSLTPLDARVLEAIAAIGYNRPFRRLTPQLSQLTLIHERLNDPSLPQTEVEQGVDTLISFGLVERLPLDDDDGSSFADKNKKIQRFIARSGRPRTLDVHITVLGEKFLLACTMPEPPSDEVPA